ncbi:MAG TPA: PspA/IM30 family protein [Chthoniobacteraceae bacterium]|jgi:phage shock protein A
MSIFTRFRDIVSSNLNAMLDAAEDPEKMIRLMIQEMEETLIEMKSACASTLATRARVTRSINEARERVAKWESNAKLALTRNSEELAREALLEKRRYHEQLQALERELSVSDDLAKDHQDQISQLEKKLVTAREKQRLLLQRHVQASQKVRAQTHIREVEVGDAVMRFDQFEARIERMEAAAGLIRPPAKPDLEERLAAMQRDDELDKELQRLKAEVQAR